MRGYDRYFLLYNACGSILLFNAKIVERVPSFIDSEMRVRNRKSRMTEGFFYPSYLQSAIVFRPVCRRKCVIGKLPRDRNFVENII